MANIHFKLTQNTGDGDHHKLGEAGVEAIVNFGAVNAGSPVEYYSDHYQEDGYHLPDAGPLSTIVQIPIVLDLPATSNVSIAYTVAGTAVAGTHYTLLSPNPLVISAGASTGTIDIDLPGDTSTWYDERSIILTITSATNSTLGGKTEWRLWVHPVDIARSIQWTSTGQTNVSGIYTIHCETVGGLVSQEPINIYYSVVTTLIETTDYTLAPASGAVVIAAGDDKTDDPSSTRLVFTLTAAGGAKSGETCAIKLEHEPSNQVEQNWWTWTDNWKLETYDVPDNSDFPGEPQRTGSRAGSGGTLMGTGPRTSPTRTRAA